MQHLLEEIKVLDAATFLAGPAAATILADFGAYVIKIEPPGGDAYRKLVRGYSVPYHWLLTGRNKKSLVVDLSQNAGQALIHKLIAKVDVMTTNFMPNQLEKYKLEYERLKTINARLIYAHITGYGTKGAEANRRAFDITGWWARSGLMDFIRGKGQKPLAPAPGMGDHCTATALFGAIMAGLYRRERTGEGSHVSTSLAANGVWANGMAVQGVMAGFDLGAYRQAHHYPGPLADVYECADGRFLVFSMLNGVREYPQLAKALDCEAWLEDERFANLHQVTVHQDAFRAVLSERLLELPLDEVVQRLERANVTHSKVQPMSELPKDTQLRQNDIIIDTPHQGSDYKQTVNSPIFVREAPKKPPRRAPEVGADSLDVLRDLDFAEQDIQAWVRAGIVHQATNTQALNTA